MNKGLYTNEAQTYIDGLPEGSVCIIIVQLPGSEAEIVTSIDKKRDLAEGLRYVADKLSPTGDA
jgi:hypothetical protein